MEEFKKCNKCGSLKEFKEFNINIKNKKTGLSAYCKECVRNSSKKYYLDNIPLYKKNTRKNRIWFDEYKETLKCSKCEENHPSCLEFHHLDPNEKESGVSEMVRKKIDKELIFKEIKKCEVLCSNCHRKLHYNLNKS